MGKRYGVYLLTGSRAEAMVDPMAGNPGADADPTKPNIRRYNMPLGGGSF